MPKKTDLYMAKEAFSSGPPDYVSVAKGDLVRAGHAILKGREGLFEPAKDYVRFDVEQATAAPGEKRGDK